MLFILYLCWGCQAQERDNSIQKVVKAYYQTYQQRSDFQKFTDFYSQDVILEDMITGDKIVGKDAFVKFFDWENPDFVKLDSNTLIIENQIIEGNQVVTKGYFTPFGWGDMRFEAMYFTTILTFNDSGKIIKHIDWINYPSNLINYSKRKNSNLWIAK